MDSCVSNYTVKLSNKTNQEDKPKTCGLPNCRTEAGGPPANHGQEDAPKVQKPCNMHECQDGKPCADQPGSSTEHDMDSCVSNCSFKLSNQGNQEDEKPTTCGLPDCRMEAGASRSENQGQKDAPNEIERSTSQPKRCNMPGCRDGEACAKGTVICLYNQPGTSEDKKKFESPGGLPDDRNEDNGSRPVVNKVKGAPRRSCNMPGCQDGEGCAKRNVNCLPAKKSGTLNENEMAKCGLPGCRSNQSNQGGDSFKGTCGLRDCRNEGASGSRSRRNSQAVEGPAGEKRASGSRDQNQNQNQNQNPCNIPGCVDEEARAAGLEVCLYRRQTKDNSIMGKLGSVYQTFWNIWQKILSDPYYWSLFKSIFFFVMGLKLYSDMAAAMNEPPPSKCPKPKS